VRIGFGHNLQNGLEFLGKDSFFSDLYKNECQMVDPAPVRDLFNHLIQRLLHLRDIFNLDILKVVEKGGHEIHILALLVSENVGQSAVPEIKPEEAFMHDHPIEGKILHLQPVFGTIMKA
jgi:hypothetical protein